MTKHIFSEFYMHTVFITLWLKHVNDRMSAVESKNKLFLNTSFTGQNSVVKKVAFFFVVQ